MVACEGGVIGTCEYARVKTTDCFAKASRLDVRPRFDPRNPMRSARVVSSVIRMMFGDFGIAAGAFGSAASALVATAVTNNNQRITTMYGPLSLRLGIVALGSSAGRRARWLNANRAQTFGFRPFPLRILFPSQLLVHTRQQDMGPRLVRFPRDCLLQGCDRALGIPRLHQSL